MTNWKERYEVLAKYAKELQQKLRETDFLVSRITSHIAESDRMDLNDRNQFRLMQLTQDVTLFAEYQSGPRNQKTYPAGTLIECNETGYVYLDDDGDGELQFPPTFLKPVEVNRDDVNWENVIQQG